MMQTLFNKKDRLLILSYDIHGGAEGDRTPGLMTASHALSQLSYSPTERLDYQKDHVNVNTY